VNSFTSPGLSVRAVISEQTEPGGRRLISIAPRQASFAAILYVATNTHSVVISAALPVAESTISTVAAKGARSRLGSNGLSVKNLTDIFARATVTPPMKPS
jgi:hypothetical protein